ncbi:aluminum-activated malate transporter 9-like isoform X1 [Typha angustifolia]|uniref:aluminum-activated malate transporter 9-like isoform X1 n=1 Tax=Typha angustifolia TaxID=59011 RepID=UPI003C2ED456
MNGNDKSSVKVDVSLSPNAVLPEFVKRSVSKERFSLRKWIREVWDFAMEDTNRVTSSLKVGLAMLLVSLLILITAPFNHFGTNIIWSILTVGIMFEYTVGATLNRGFNRAVGSLIAGIFAIVVIQISLSSGGAAAPYVVGLSIFLVGAITSFMKLWPSLAPYEYGFRVILFTYCLIIVSVYRIGDPMKTGMERLYSIAIGAVITVLVNLLVFPIWAGEQLHKELVGSFDTIADSLEECVKKYLSDYGSNKNEEFSKTITDDFPDEPAFRKCRGILNSSARFDSLASSAKWEPPHGKFPHFFYPWSQYVRVGAVLRHCAYEVMALHGCLHSEIQAPYNLRMAFQTEILEATVEAAELLHSLGSDISNMNHSVQTNLLKGVHNSIYRLQHSIELHSYLLTSTHHPFDCCDKPTNTLSLTLKDCSNLLANGNAGINARGEPLKAESYHEAMRKQQRRLHSWPSREVDELEEDGGIDTGLIPKMCTLESTAALSVATFTSLLVEFVARLDHLVDAVDELSKMAKFKEQSN